MMPDVSCKKKVIAALKRYPSQKKKMELLRFELEHPSQVSEEELIESLSLSKSMDGGGPSGHISNKTMRIALQFQDEAQRMNGEVVVQIAQELDALAAEITRIDYHIALLEPEQGWIIRGYYLERRTWAALAAETGLSQRALIARRDAGLKELTGMVEFLGRIKGETPEYSEEAVT